MKWNDPEFLRWLLALLPLFILTGLMIKQREKRLERMAEKGLWSDLLPHHSVQRRHVKNGLRVLILALALAAVARPQWGFKWEKVTQRGLSIIVALDTSKSMLAQDIKPNRLQQAKWGVRDLVKELRGDRIGLVAFAGDAFLQCPTTIDYAAFLMMLDDVYAGIIPLGGTDLFQAVEESLDSFEKETAADKVIILISDGEGTTGNPLALLPRLKEEKIRIFAIGVGTREGELIQTSEGFVKDSAGHVVKSALNEGVLKHLAAETGGFYIRSAPGDFGLERVYQQGIAQLQREERESRMAKIGRERFQWFLGAALLLLFIEALIRPTKMSRIRTKKKPVVASLTILLCLALPLLAKGEETPRSAMHNGLKAYQTGDYTNAVQWLEKAAVEFPNIGNYNLGNAHYRKGDYEAAEQAFNEALRTTDLELQAKAYFNRGNALLARTTVMTGPEQIGLAAELAFQAVGLYEKSMLLNPEDLAAKQNFEKARQLRLRLEYTKGKWLFDHAEALLQDYKAKAAKKNYQQAQHQFEHILNHIDSSHGEAQQLLPKISAQLERLRRSVEEAESDLKIALQQIEDYQYALATQRLTTESDERKFAFDLKPDLKKEFEETVQKNQEVLKIIQELSTLNMVPVK